MKSKPYWTKRILLNVGNVVIPPDFQPNVFLSDHLHPMSVADDVDNRGSRGWSCHQVGGGLCDDAFQACVAVLLVHEKQDGERSDCDG